VLRDVLQAVGAPLVPKVIDVRRGCAVGLDPRRSEIDRGNYVRVEAETFVRYCIAAAPAALGVNSRLLLHADRRSASSGS